MLGLWVVTQIGNAQSTTQSIIFLMSLTLLPILLLEFRFRRPPLLRNLDGFEVLKRADPVRVAVKLLALYTIYAGVAFIYWLMPEYAGSFYQPFWNYITPAVPWLIVLAAPYFWLIDALQDEPRDEYFELGCRLLQRSADNRVIGQLLLGWLVKGFFLPLMIIYLGNNVESFASGKFSFEWITANFGNFYEWMWLILLTVDLAFVSIGYSATFKIIDSNIRSTEPTMLGWCVALICYDPFSSRIFSLYSDYNMDGFSWGQWLSGHHVLYAVWGSAILLLMVIYSAASVAFGHRFSNLTHRGIITNGVYRFSKHPAYLAKNLSWWLISIPFITATGDWMMALKACLLLVVVNLVYYLRAKTEERHLSWDPVYREYADWVNQHGVLAVLRRFLKTTIQRLFRRRVLK